MGSELSGRSSSTSDPSAAPAADRLRGRANDEDGFSLIELLVVILIIGVLAAIAIPSFLSNTTKAVDSQAKELARTAETTAETISAENNGRYDKVTAAELNRAEPSIRIATSTSEAYLSGATGGEATYTITATASNGDEFTISRSATGISRTCASPIEKTGCAGGEASSW